MTTAIDSFTGDVAALMRLGGRHKLDEAIRAVPRDELPEFLRRGLIETLAPIMLETPPFVQQIVGRALMEHVDWQTVAAMTATNPEAN